MPKQIAEVPMSAESFFYLDNHATTRCDPRVLQAMWPFFGELYANAGSVTHRAGQQIADLVADCRERIARGIGAARASEIVFTAGATESNALALLGTCLRRERKPGHLISVQTEHAAVLAPLQRLERLGWEVTRLPVQPAGHPCAGVLDPDQFQSAIRGETFLASVMLANNEIGAIQPLAAIAGICRERGIILHCDASQALGKIPVDLSTLDVDLLSFSAHKLHGPKGVGGLFVRGDDSRRIRIESWIEGGGQEGRRRGGTLNVPGIVGMARALELAVEGLPGEAERMRGLRNRFWDLLQQAIPSVVLNGPALERSDLRLPNNLNCQFPGVDGHSLMVQTPDVALSSGSACTATQSEPSHVLTALGMDADQVRCSLRFGWGRFNDESELEPVVQRLAAAHHRLRASIG